MSGLRDAFISGRRDPGATSAGGKAQAADPVASPFEVGAEWVRNVLVPAIEAGNTELRPENIAFQLDLNLDHRSTPHPHADFWLTEIGGDAGAVGPRHSINVKQEGAVWL
jgi:hypothetical protein